MAAVTQTISNFLGGVSNQPDDKKLPGQVRGAINAYPDPTFGLTKRPGFKFLTQLESATTGGSAYDNNDLDKGKWFYINRYPDEKYIGAIVGNATEGDAAIHIWNVAEVDGNGDYVKCTVNYGTNTRQYLNAVNAEDYHFLNVRDTSIVTNKTKQVTAVAGDAFTEKRVGTIRLHLVEYSSAYQVKITITGGATYTCTLNTRAGDTASDNTDTTNFLDSDDILVALKDGSSTGGTYAGHTGGLNGIPNMTAEVIHNAIELTLSTGQFSIAECIGGKGKTSLSSYQDGVDGVTDMASETKHGRTVLIANPFNSASNYYTKFKANNGVSGPGVWEECLGPGQEKGLNSATMPHKLYNTNKNVFSFIVIENPLPGADGNGIAGVFGEPRLVGDADSNPHPSFKDNYIQQAFYYNTRLGFLTADNVSMSRVANIKTTDFFNFYYKSAQTIIDSDPIDLSCSSIRDATLHGILPSAGGLILFSEDQQFIMFSADGNLSPKTALIRGLSNYQMDTKIDPVDMGTNINFISKTHETAGFSRVFAMLPQGIGQIPKVVDIGRGVSEYIPATITGLTANPQNSFIAMWGNTDDKIYFYRTYSDGEQDLVQSWFNWQCPGNVHYVTIDSDTMYAVIKTGSGSDARYNLVTATMTMTPEETIIVTAEGQQINPHMDFYTAADNGLSGGSNKKVVYDSTNDFSKCYIPFKDVTSLTPVIVIAGNATSNFSGTTESGFTITPTRASDGDGTYFKVPRKDLSGQAANVYVGYKYNYDITLPKIYFTKDQEGKVADFTANLTVARCKFSIGKSSVVGFKLNRKGVQADTQSFTGDGSNVAFSPDFTVKDKADVIVKRNGTKQTLVTTFTGSSDEKKSQYKIADHAQNPDQITITFGTAPAAAATVANVTTAADSVEVYVDQWYTLQPTQEANYYLGDDVPLEEQNIFIVPIHQRTDNYTLRVFSDSPFPVALTSMAWEGNYSPRYYRRT